MKIRYPIRAGLYVALLVGLAWSLLLTPASAAPDVGAALIAAVMAGRGDTLRRLALTAAIPCVAWSAAAPTSMPRCPATAPR